jgi:glycosyltransferase involved in cell wall biosynthesis
VRIVIADPPSYTRPYDHSLAAALARRGHDVHLVASPFRYGSVPEPNGYRTHEVFLPVSNRLFRAWPRSRLRYLVNGLEYVPSAARLVRRVRELEPDVVHVRWLWPLAKDHPIVFTAHDLPAARAPDPVWREPLGMVDRVVVHSRRGVEALERFGIDADRIRQIPHPVFDAGVFQIRPPTGRTLLFFGLMRQYKGLDVLVSALPAIGAALPDARLVVAGDPLDPVEPVRELAERLGVSGRIEWRLGFLLDAEVRELMEASALVVLPYRRLDASGVLGTALGHGRPVVVSDVGSLAETVAEFGAGRVVPAGDAEALASACIELLRDDEELNRAYAGALRAAATLTWDGAARAHERVYQEVA